MTERPTLATLPTLQKALAKATAKARKLHLIDDDGDGGDQ